MVFSYMNICEKSEDNVTGSTSINFVAMQYLHNRRWPVIMKFWATLSHVSRINTAA